MFTKTLKVTDLMDPNIYVGLDIHYKSWKICIYSVKTGNAIVTFSLLSLLTLP